MALASDVITRVRDTLLDPGTTYRWTDAELLRYLTDVQRLICGVYPEANTQTALVTPDAADVRIDLRIRVTNPIAILRMAAAQDEKANTLGYELKVVERSVLDALDPGWYGYRPALAAYNTKATNAQYYKAAVLDPKDPLAFWLYPRAHPDFRVLVTYTASPVVLAATSDALSLQDHFVPVLTDALCAKALMKDSVYTGAPGKAQEFAQAANAALSAMIGRRVELFPTNARAGEEH